MTQDTLLISCPNELGGVFLANDRKSVRLSSQPSTGFYLDDSQLIIACQANGANVVKTIVDGLPNDIKLSKEPLDLHDMYFSDSCIYAVATEYNSIFCLDGEFRTINKWSLPGENDSVHINSITLYRGQFLASIFGRFHYHRQYKEGTKGKGEVVNIETGKTYIKGLSQPHSLTVDGELLYLCSSEDKEVHVYDGNQLIRKIKTPGYARGLALGSKKIYAGISLSRNINLKENGIGTANIAVIDKKSMDIERFINISSEEIYDIRIVGLRSWVLPFLLDDIADEQRRIEKLNDLYRRSNNIHDKMNIQLKQEIDAISFKGVRRTARNNMTKLRDRFHVS